MRKSKWDSITEEGLIKKTKRLKFSGAITSAIYACLVIVMIAIAIELYIKYELMSPGFHIPLRLLSFVALFEVGFLIFAFFAPKLLRTNKILLLFLRLMAVVVLVISIVLSLNMGPAALVPLIGFVLFIVIPRCNFYKGNIRCAKAWKKLNDAKALAATQAEAENSPEAVQINTEGIGEDNEDTASFENRASDIPSDNKANDAQTDNVSNDISPDSSKTDKESGI